MSHQASFGVSTPAEFLNQILLPQYRDFLDDNSSTRHALLTTIAAYHMYEWVHGATFTMDDFNQTYPDSESMGELFDLARKLSNGFKHFKETVETHRQSGFSSGFSDDFARPLVIHIGGGIEMSADHLLSHIVGFWEEEKGSDFQRQA